MYIPKANLIRNMMGRTSEKSLLAIFVVVSILKIITNRMVLVDRPEKTGRLLKGDL